MTTQSHNELSDADLAHILGFSLSEQQLSAVKAPREPAVMVAGAGSGKTTSMSARIAFLIGSGYLTPEQVLGLTFTTKATAQLLESARSRISTLMELDPQSFTSETGDPVIATYNSFASGIVKEFGALLGRDFSTDVLTDGERQQLAYRLVCNTQRDLSGISVGPAKLTSELLALDSELSELAIDPASVIEYDLKLISYVAGLHGSNASLRKIASTSGRRIALARMVQDWRELKKERQLIEFSDQVRLATKIVTQFPQVAMQIRSRFEIALLDEYQDTSISQRILLETIFSGGFPVTAVGDPCQAIYGWRGASVENINSFPRQFRTKDDQPASVYPLSANRRSGVQILELANLISENLRAEHPSVQKLDPTRELQGNITLALFDFADQEITWMADRIAEQHEAIHAAGLGDDIAVLAATGNYLLRMRDALQQRGIPVQLHSAAGLLSHPLVIDLRAILEVIHEPTANPSFVRWASGVKWRIGARDLAALGARAAELAKTIGHPSGASVHEADSIDQALSSAVEGIDLVDIVSLSDALFDLGPLDHYSTSAIDRFGKMAGVIRSVRPHAGEPLVEFLGRVIRATGIDVQSQLNASDAIAVNELINLAADFTDADGRVSLGAFISRLNDIERFDITLDFEQPVEKGAVQLITIYKAKGLEYTHVYLPNLSDKAFPGGQARSNWSTDATMAPWPLRQDAPPAIAAFPDYSLTKLSETDLKNGYLAHFESLKEREVERLAYVALTRAKDSLTLTGSWWGVNWKTPHGPHPFLTAAHDLLAGTSAHIPFWAPSPDGDRPERAEDPGEWPWPLPVPQGTREGLVRQSEYVHESTTPLAEVTENDSATVDRWESALAALQRERERLHVPVRTIALPRSLGASSMLRAMREPEVLAVELARPMPQQPNYIAARGTEIHAFIETHYDRATLFDWDELEGAWDRTETDTESVRNLKSAFLSSRFARLSPVAVEQQFSLTIRGRFVTGYIDAVFEIDGRYLVVDWKTGGTDHLDPTQLAFYRLAWAQIAGVDWKEVDTAFVMLALGTELPVDTDGIIHDLERQLA
jgi:DNA helicase-2/ATP-dependent DNA helicase PcrA